MEGEGEHDASQESSTWTVDYCASRCNLLLSMLDVLRPLRPSITCMQAKLEAQ
jgi:hypothetical protein